MSKSTLLALGLLTTLGLAACSNEASVNKAENTGEATKTEEVASVVPAIGDTITFENEAEITIKDTSFTDYRNSFEESKPSKVLIVTYDVKNLSSTDYLVGSEISLYVNGKKMESYPIEGITLDSISANRVFENAKVGFGVTEDGEMELEVTPSMSFTAKAVVMPISPK